MIVKSVTQVGNSVIRKKSKKVVEVTSPKIKKIIKDLTDSMRHANLVGMAAPQIGYNLRIFVTEIRKTRFRKASQVDKLKIFINPKIISVSKNKISGYEGCGSVADAGLFGKISRSSKITVSAFNEQNIRFTLTTTGLLARVIQHEFDHIEGIVFLDKLTDKHSLMSKVEYLKRKK